MLASTNPDDREFDHKNRRGDQVGVSKSLTITPVKEDRVQPETVARSVLAPVTFEVANLSQEQEIFSSEKYQQSVSRGLTGELLVELSGELPVNDAGMIDGGELVDAKTSSWTAVSAMLDKRKNKLALLPDAEQQSGQKVVVDEAEVKPTPVDKLGQARVEKDDLPKKPDSIILPEKDKGIVDTSRSTILDLSRPSRRQFMLELMPVGLKSKLVLKQESKSKMLTPNLSGKHDEVSSMPAGKLNQVQHDKVGVQYDRKKDRVRIDGKRSRADKVKTKKGLSYWLSWLLIAGGVLIAIIFVVPDLYFRLAPADVIKLGEVKGLQNDSPTETQATPIPTPTPYVPPIDPDLPTGQWLIIPEIGVKTQPQATEDPEVALKDGVWIAPEYGQIGQPGMPIIMAAHRFGWKWWWQSDYWKLNSFYNLPETKEGTIVELIADQRKWTYLIYGGEEGDAITDYSADLILYTCKFLNSPIRHVRYARLIDPTRPEQVLNQDSRPLSDEEKTELGKLFSLPY